MVELAIVILGTLAAIAIVAISYSYPTVGLTLGLIFFSFPMLEMLGGYDLRPAILLVVLGLALRAGSFKHVSDISHYIPLFLGMLVMLFASLFSLSWSVDATKTALSIGALVATILLLWAVSKSMRAKQIQNAVLACTASIVVPSIVLGLVGGGAAFEGGRLAGITSNANALGIFALLMACAGIFHGRLVVRHLSWTIALSTTLLAGSRASAAALVLLVALTLWFQHRGMAYRILLALASIAGVSFVMASDLMSMQSDDPTSVFRTNDSRTEFISLGLYEVERYWPWGIGAGNASQTLAAVNVILKTAVEFGIVSFLILSVFSVLLFWQSSTSKAAIITAVICISNNMFEGWMLTFGTSFTVMFYLLILSLSGSVPLIRPVCVGDGRNWNAVNTSNTRAVDRERQSI